MLDWTVTEKHNSLYLHWILNQSSAPPKITCLYILKKTWTFPLFTSLGSSRPTWCSGTTRTQRKSGKVTNAYLSYKSDYTVEWCWCFFFILLGGFWACRYWPSRTTGEWKRLLKSVRKTLDMWRSAVWRIVRMHKLFVIFWCFHSGWAGT